MPQISVEKHFAYGLKNFGFSGSGIEIMKNSENYAQTIRFKGLISRQS